MGLNLINLEDENIRELMLEEFEMDKRDDKINLSAFMHPDKEFEYITILEEVIKNGNDSDLSNRVKPLLSAKSFKTGRSISAISHETFGEGEFNRYYIRAVCRKAIKSGGKIIVYRAKQVTTPRPDSERKIGELAIKIGAKAYIGYEASFMLVRDPTRVGNPHKDKNALPFKKACSTLINALVFGSSVETAIEKTKEEYLNSIKSYGTSEDNPYGDTPLIRFALAWN